MKKVLYILGELEDDDAEWLSQQGTVRRLAKGDLLIREGQSIDFVCFVTGGTFLVTAGSPARELARVGTGEVLGEVSFIDRYPPTATVTAAEDAAVLAVSTKALTDKIHADPGFAGRFYRAVAVFLADRLRGTLRQLGGGGETADDSELDLEALDSVSKAGVRFERILRRLQEV